MIEIDESDWSNTIACENQPIKVYRYTHAKQNDIATQKGCLCWINRQRQLKVIYAWRA
jgi:hypothetical protein